MLGKHTRKVRQITAGYAGCLLVACYGCSVGWIGPIQLHLQSLASPVGRLSKHHIAWLASIPYVASMTIGIFVFGSISNHIGRKTLAYILASIYLASNLVIYYTSSFGLILAARFAIGSALPATVTTIALYTAEISDPGVRGNLGSANMLFCNAGIILMFVGHSFLTYDEYNLLLVSVPALFISLFWMMPESPVFYLKMQRLEDCRNSLRWFKATEDNAVLEEEMDKLRAMFFSQEATISLSWREVLSTKYYRKSFLLGIVLLSSICSSGVTTIETYIFSILSHCMDDQHPGKYPAYLLFLSVTTMVVSLFIMDHFSRRTMAIAPRLVCSALLITFGTLLMLKDLFSFSIPFLVFFAVILVYLLTYNIGFSNVVFVIIGELFSVECRDLFMQPLMLLHFFLHGFYLMLYPITVVHIQIFTWFFIHAGITIVFTLIIVFYLPETRNKSIAEIVKELSKHK